PADPAMAQRRADARRRSLEAFQRATAKCTSGAADVLVGGNILAPMKLVDVKPIFPDQLKVAKVGGTVTMDAVIGTDGLVRDVLNVKGPHPDLETAAAEAVRQWEFSTTMLNCDPIEVEMHVTVDFSIQQP